MTGIPLRVTLAALGAIVIALGVALGIRFSRGPAPASQATTGPSATATSATGQTTVGQALTRSQMIAAFPKQAGGLRLESTQGSALAYNFVPLPECFGPTETADLTAVKTLPKLDGDINEPVVSGMYGGDVDGFEVQLFRFSPSKLTEVSGLIKAAPAHCTQASGEGNNSVDVGERLSFPLGEESASYRTYKAVSAQRTDIRVPDSDSLVALSKGWGVTVSTLGATDSGETAMKQASLVVQDAPDFLRGLDQALGTAFWPANGTIAALTFPAPMPFLANNGKASTPVYEPASFWVSQDASLELTDLQWTSWTTSTATGSGAVEVNSCVPNCAGGTYHKYSVQVTLSQPDDSCEYAYFGSLRLHWLAGKPSGFKDETFPVRPGDCNGT